MNKATPLPLRAVLETKHTSAEILDAKGHLIASFAVRPYKNRTNRDVRVMARAHDLLAALESVRAWLAGDLEAAEESGETVIDLGTLHARMDELEKQLGETP